MKITFYSTKSSDIMQDDDFARLLAFPNVLITGHQAFLTHTALTEIARVTLDNLCQLEAGRKCPNEVCAEA